MTEVKMPEPAGTICFDGGAWEEDWVSSQSAYSDDQLKQYGDDRAREALEMAANAVHEIPRNGAWVTKVEAITAIEELLAKEIK